LGAPLLTRTDFGYAAGMLNSYLVNRSWTFGSREPVVGRQMVRFVLSKLGLLVLSMALLQGLVVGLGLTRFVGKIITVGLSLP
jgi:putative flippase GtrA